MKFHINGKERIVHVDDFVPVHWQDKLLYSSGAKSGVLPIFADSSHFGVIWPMLIEKAWAKIHGSYALSEGGLNDWILSFLTNQPYRTLDTLPLENNATKTALLYNMLLQYTE